MIEKSARSFECDDALHHCIGNTGADHDAIDPRGEPGDLRQQRARTSDVPRDRGGDDHVDAHALQKGECIAAATRENDVVPTAPPRRKHPAPTLVSFHHHDAHPGHPERPWYQGSPEPAQQRI